LQNGKSIPSKWFSQARLVRPWSKGAASIRMGTEATRAHSLWLPQGLAVASGLFRLRVALA
jgi:hypothetical protein